jgi:MFS family permease
MMFVYGVGDSVFHPANYSILSRTISPHRIGKAYAIHNFSGQLGFATAPLVTGFVAAWLGWAQALLVFGSAGIGVASLVFVSQGMLSGQHVAAKLRPRPKPATGSGLAVLLSRPLLLSLVMFIGLSLVNSAIRDFGAAVLSTDAGFTAVQTGMVISCFLGAVLVGVLAGGWVVDRTCRPDAIAVCVLGLIAIILAVVSLAGFGLTMLAVLFAALGLSIGILGPTRDLLVRSLVSVEHIGKAFGFVSLGISMASLVAPPLYGFLLDHMEPLFVFQTAAGFAVATMVVILVQSAQPR